MLDLYGTEKYTAVIEKAISCALKRFDVPEKDISLELELVSPEEIKELNREMREIDSVTDVLSFPGLERVLPFDINAYSDEDIDPETGAVILGEIYICRERAEEQAQEYGHSLARELAFLSVHGTLHLLGYDHVNESERAEMEALQDEILASAGITRNMTDDQIIASINQEAENRVENPFRTGYAVILGKPNAGKSTLINAIIGEKVSIVSWKPQTTRNRIIGVYNGDDVQVIFVDTPGIHKPRNELGKFMMRSVKVATDGVDAVIYVVDAEKGIDDADISNIEANIGAGRKTVVAVNKIDHVTRDKVAEILVRLNKIPGMTAVVPVSALRQKNVDVLIDEVQKLMPIGEKLYSDDVYTDRNMRFMASEIIREKALRLLDKEIPYGIAVSINKYEYRENGILDIDADVICQKSAHKPIILGKNGEMIKRISTYARQDLEDMTGDKIYLTLWVKVKEDWRDDLVLLNNLGYNKKDDT